ncbi:MAG: hypothetical protein U0821_19445 [Chloroflexota bacterium]
MSVGPSLRETWVTRTHAASLLVRLEEQMRTQVQSSSVEELVELIESFSPTRVPDTEWTHSFEALVERLWVWCDDAAMAGLHEVFAARGLPWMAVANAFAVERGAELRRRVRKANWARLHAFSVA